MGVYINKSRGKPRPYWTGVYKINGARYTVKLNRWSGEPGSPEFETSRKKAENELKTIADTARKAAALEYSEPNVQAVAAMQALAVLPPEFAPGGFLPFKEISEKFAEYKKTRCKGGRYAWTIRMANSFLEHLKKSGATNLETSTAEQVRVWLDSKRGSPYTNVANLGLVKLLYRKYCKTFTRVYGDVNEMKERPSVSQSHKIFTPEELTHILETAAKLSPLVKSLAVIAACTGLRFKDIALLQWSSINLERCLISLTTHKTHGAAIIGIWPLLRKELETLPKSGPYLFPEAAKNYKAFFLRAIRGLRKVLTAAGYPVEEMTEQKAGYLRRATLYGWHSFRGSFVVAALRAGVSMEILKKILGSKTVDIIYRHYIQVDDGFLRDAFTSKAPAFAKGK